jgi:replicative superfamily II helicase
MNLKQNTERFDTVENDGVIQNFIAQANSRYILLNTSESAENFPPYTIRDNNLSILAFYYLEIGATYAENQSLDLSRVPLEKGATILEHIHGSEANRAELSIYYVLVSALAYYAGFQYSKSYILINKIETTTVIAQLVAYFLRRNYVGLKQLVEELSIDEDYTDNSLSDGDETDSADRIYEITIARALYAYVGYFETGAAERLETARQQLLLLKEISELKSEPSIWWIVRLLIIISEGFNEAALWNALAKHFDITDQTVKDYIHALVYQSPMGIYELFITQRKSLPTVLDPTNESCVVTIPTSSGKTRIAEIAIVDCLLKAPDKKVLYIAPFKSLAFEVENSLEPTLMTLGFQVSHLYGGSLFSKVEQSATDEASLIIATPEKAKAITRGNNDIADQIGLIIIDEGHLLGPDKRLIVNEAFYEELRFIANKNGAKFLLLSAVLPNADELAEWLAGSPEAVFKDTWRPSDERFGILDWTGNQVNLEWINNDVTRPSFNNKFIVKESIPLVGRQRKPRFHPGDKNEAVGATAYKLRNFGTVLIFVGRKQSVFVIAEAYEKCLPVNSPAHNYKNSIDWKAYELACVETYGENNDWLTYAKKGILCHHGALHTDVRLPLERLMRNSKPLVVISTSTLGQGVNLGVSTVIFSTYSQGGSKLTARDFWNIAGRAGRAFVDHEGKILVAIDTDDSAAIFSDISDMREQQPRQYILQKRNIVERKKKEIKKYFDRGKIDIATSGIMLLIRALKRITEENDIPFVLLLELIADNNIDGLGENAKEIDDALDWMDDTLLALHKLHYEEDDDKEQNYDWIDNFFRHSLAYIQIKAGSSLSKQNLLDFIQARIKGIIKKVGNNTDKWTAIIRSGIPLNSDIYIETKLPEIVELLDEYLLSNMNLNDKTQLAKDIIDLIKETPVFEEDGTEIKSLNLQRVIDLWLRATPMSRIIKIGQSEEIIAKLFSYKFPWLLNGIAKKMKLRDNEIFGEILEEVAMMFEVGVPKLAAVKIYQAGIRSRVSANELSNILEEEIIEQPLRKIRKDIIAQKTDLELVVSAHCFEWISMLESIANQKLKIINRVVNFTYDVDEEILIARKINDTQYLVSPDLSFMGDISDSTIDFNEVNNLAGIYFIRKTKTWRMVVDNPYVNVN